MERPAEALLPYSAVELERLPIPTAQAVIQAVDAEQRRAHEYASLGMICGTASFLGCVGAFCYLETTGHPAGAGIILGTGVLATIGRMIAARL